jgi:hypothetical protein
MSERAEICNVYFGNVHSVGKSLFVAAVKTTADCWPRQFKLVPTKGFRRKEIEALTRTSSVAGSDMVSDRLAC